MPKDMKSPPKAGPVARLAPPTSPSPSRRDRSGSNLSNVGTPERADASALTKMPPMPDRDVLERQLMGVMEAMNIPKAKQQGLLAESDEKKWQLVWGHMATMARNPPGFYLNQLIAHLEAQDRQRAKKKHKPKKLPAGTQDGPTLLRGLEISLRTNSLQWVKDFISYIQPPDEKGKDQGRQRNGGLNILMEYFVNLDDEGRERTEDYMCVLCLRALMNNAYGFTSVMAHPQTIIEICSCLRTVSPFKSTPDPVVAQGGSVRREDKDIRRHRTHVLVLELMAAVCLVPNGHAKVVEAFSEFQRRIGETRRFQTLMNLLRTERHNINAMVACMAFVNVVVHCVSDMNYQVALQTEFTMLGIMPIIAAMKKNATTELLEQISGYTENFVSVSFLADEARLRVIDLQTIDKMEEHIQLQEQQAQADRAQFDEKVTAARKQISEQRLVMENLSARLAGEKAEHEANVARMSEEITQLKSGVAEARKRASQAEVDCEEARKEAASVTQTLRRLSEGHEKAAAVVAVAAVASPAVASVSEGDSQPPSPQKQQEQQAPPPPPPPPPPMGVPPPPPPPPPMGAGGAEGADMPELSRAALGGSVYGTMKKRRHNVEVKLPILNWATVPVAHIENTVFSGMDDDKVIDSLDFGEFNMLFRVMDKDQMATLRKAKASKKDDDKWKSRLATGPVSVLDPSRARNLGIAQRRVGTDIDAIAEAIIALNVNRITAEVAELLRGQFVPSDEEAKLLGEQHDSGKKMADIDVFLYKLSRIPRLRQRLNLLAFMNSCNEIVSEIEPQTDAVIAAADSLMSSDKLRRVLEIVLAFGNYMNSQRRGGAFGFKLNVFERLADTKSPADRSVSLLHYIAGIIRDKYADLLDFPTEIVGLDRAARVSFESLEGDVAAVERTVSAIVAELKIDATNETLLEFERNLSPRADKARQDLNQAKLMVSKAVAFFAEDPKTDNTVFFGRFAKFIAQMGQADKENEVRRQRDAKRKARDLQEQRHLETESEAPSETATKGVGMRDDITDGAIDEIITDLKNKAFRRAGVGKTVKKRTVGEGSDANFQSYAAARPWLK